MFVKFSFMLLFSKIYIQENCQMVLKIQVALNIHIKTVSDKSGVKYFIKSILNRKKNSKLEQRIPKRRIKKSYSQNITVFQHRNTKGH